MQVGDIMTVKVKITDKAKIENATARSRTNKENSGVTDFIGSKLLTGHGRASHAGQAPDRGLDLGDATARARSTARKRCSPTSPPSSRRCCRTAIW